MSKSKFLIKKINSNQVQYDLDRQNAKISALSSGELDKNEYLSCEDLGYKPDVVQKAKFEFSPSGQVFKRGLEKDEKQVGLLKRLKNIEDKTDNQLKENKESQLGIKPIGYIVEDKLSQEAKNMLEKLSNQEEFINYQKRNFTGGNNVDYDFSDCKSLKELFKAIYYRNITVEESKRIQEEFDAVYGALKKYKPRKETYVKTGGNLLINAKNVYKGRQLIIDVSKNKIFPMNPAGFSEDDEDEDELLKKTSRREW